MASQPREQQEWDDLRWPGLWAPVAAAAAYLAAEIVYGSLGAAAAGLVRAAGGKPILSSVLAWSNAAAIATMGAVSLALVLRTNRTLQLKGIARLASRTGPDDWKLVVISLVAVLPAGIAVAALVTTRLGLRVDPVVNEVLSAPGSLIAAVFVAPLGEELWARGLVFGALARWGRAAAVVGATVASAALHYQPVRVLGVVPVMFALSWLRHRTGRLAPCVMLHALYNLLLVGMTLLARAAGAPTG